MLGAYSLIIQHFKVNLWYLFYPFYVFQYLMPPWNIYNHFYLLVRNWNREREISDRDQLLSMRFTTNAEAAKGMLLHKHTNFSFKFFYQCLNTNVFIQCFKSTGLNSDGYGGESTAILIDKALEHQNALGVSSAISLSSKLSKKFTTLFKQLKSH